MRILLYVQHLLGIGHVRRASLLAAALTQAGADVTVASGGFPVPGIGFPGSRLVQLPPARAADAGFSGVLDEAGQPIDDAWKSARARQLLAVFNEVRPDALILETYPFGRRRFRFELEPLLNAARDQGDVLIASSVRDILVGKADPAKEADMADRARRWFDLVLVHGDPALIDFAATFPYADRIADLLRYTGYVTGPQAGSDFDMTGDGSAEVVVSVGGGAVGDRLLRAAMAARPATGLAETRWRFLLGPDVPEDTAAAMRRGAGETVIVEPARPDFPALLRRCRLSISQAGYNTVLDVLGAGCRAVLVPFAEAGESEQTVRARILAERGMVEMVEESDLTVDRLTAAIVRAVGGEPAAKPSIRMDGGTASAALIIGGVERRNRSNNGKP